MFFLIILLVLFFIIKIRIRLGAVRRVFVVESRHRRLDLLARGLEDVLDGDLLVGLAVESDVDDARGAASDLVQLLAPAAASNVRQAISIMTERSSNGSSGIGVVVVGRRRRSMMIRIVIILK